MRIRSTLIAGLAVAVAVAIVASAAVAGVPVTGNDGNSQSIESAIAPKRLSKSTFTPASLTVTTKLTTTTAANGVPSPTSHVQIDFDKNAQIFAKGYPTCDPAKLQNVSTEVAERECKPAIIGKGTATVLLPVGEKLFSVPAVVTAFNGVPKGGKPIILLHTYSTSPVQTVVVLNGPVLNYNKQGYGPRLELEVPKLAGGAGALTDFQVTINKKFRYKGKPVSYISAKCPNSKKLKTRSVFTFLDGETVNPVASQTCTQKK